MPLDRREAESALLSKGFSKSQTDHRVFIYHSLDGKKTAVRTMTSHGSKYKNLDDSLVNRMAKQCRLTTGDFRHFVSCALDRKSYEAKLESTGVL